MKKLFIAPRLTLKKNMKNHFILALALFSATAAFAGGDATIQGLVHGHIPPLLSHASIVLPELEDLSPEENTKLFPDEKTVKEKKPLTITKDDLNKCYALKKLLAKRQATWTKFQCPDHLWHTVLKNPQDFPDLWSFIENEDCALSFIAHTDAPNNRAFIHKTFIVAARLGRTNDVKRHLDAGADVHTNNDNALFVAAGHGYPETVQLLIERGADIYANRCSALLCASGKGFLKIVQLLLEASKNNPFSAFIKNDAFERAAFNGHADVVKLLLLHGAFIHTDNDEALRTASSNGHLETVQLLLDNGADVNAQHPYDGTSALTGAVLGGHTAVARELLNHGAHIHVNNDSLVYLASCEGYTDTVTLLLENGADIHADYDAALRIAFERCHTETVECLLAHGAHRYVIEKGICLLL